MGVRSRGMLARTSAVVVLAGLVGVGLVRPGVPSPEPTVSQFLLDWESQQYLAAARLTTGPPTEVAAALSRAYQGLDASNLDLTMHSISQDGKSATARFDATIDLASSGLTWAYTGNFGLTDGRSGWRIRWSPSVIVPGMTDREQLAVVSSWDPRSQVLDSAGQPLTVASTVYEVGVYPDQLSNRAATASDLAAATAIPVDQIEGQIEAAVSGDFLGLLTLSPAGYSKLKSVLKDIPGVIVRPKKERLFDSIAPDVVGSVGTETASVLRTNGVQYRPGTTVGLSGLQQTFQRQLIGTPSTIVVLQQAGQAAVRLKAWPGSAGTPVKTTLSSTVQLAADHALANLPASAAIVAVQAKTGKILAVSSHRAAGMPRISPLAKGYEPGQAFTIVSSAAILSAGQLAPGDPVPCPASNSVDGRVFVNNPREPDLGATPSFRTDFAHACSTAFAGGLSISLTADELAKASEEFGIGGWQLPVSSYFAGQIGQPIGEGRLAADVIGTGDDLVSPLGMALAASVVDSGKFHPPSLVNGLTDASTTERTAASPQVLTSLRDLMRAAMKTDSNQVADVGGNVFGQVGNAPFAAGSKLRIDWLVGYQGGIAFAVVELGKSASASAAPLTGSFLQNIQTGS